MSRGAGLRQTAQVLGEFDRLLINAMQGGFPLSSTPFDDLAVELDLAAYPAPVHGVIHPVQASQQR